MNNFEPHFHSENYLRLARQESPAGQPFSSKDSSMHVAEPRKLTVWGVTWSSFKAIHMFVLLLSLIIIVFDIFWAIVFECI